MRKNILTILDQRDEAEMRLKALQTEIDEFYTTLEKGGLALHQEASGQYSPRRFFWRKDSKLISVKYPTERDALEAHIQNEIKWKP